jgi:hypothetical protein
MRLNLKSSIAHTSHLLSDRTGAAGYTGGTAVDAQRNAQRHRSRLTSRPPRITRITARFPPARRGSRAHTTRPVECAVWKRLGGAGAPLGLPRAHARPRRASTPRPAPAAGPPPACFVPVPVPWCCGLRAAGAAAAGPAAGRTTAGPAFLAYSRPLSARGRRAHRAPRARGRPRAGRSRPGRSDRDAPRFVVGSSAPGRSSAAGGGVRCASYDY